MGQLFKHSQILLILSFCVLSTFCDTNLSKPSDKPQQIPEESKKVTTLPATKDVKKVNVVPDPSLTSNNTDPPITVTVQPTLPGPTTEKPSSTPAPSSEKKPTFNVTEGNVTCVVLESYIDIIVPYHKKDNTVGTANITVPSYATSSGHCNKTENHQDIELSWSLASNVTAFAKFNFEKNSTESALTTVAINITATNVTFPESIFPGIRADEKLEYEGKNLSEFATHLDMSYHCAKDRRINVTKVGNETLEIVFRELQFEAFKKSNGTQFDSAIDCEPFITPDIVPIIVGCTLALLVIVVLVAYLIARRKQPARGYLSM